MYDEYKINLRLGDEYICPSTLHRFRKKVVSNDPDQQVDNSKNDEQMVFIPEKEKFQYKINANAPFVLNCPENVNAQDSSKNARVSNSCIPTSDSAMEDSNILNFIHNFFMEECDTSLFAKKNPRNLKELIQSDGFLETIKTSVNKSPGEILLTVLDYSIQNNLSVMGIVNLFKLINNIFTESILPDSKYFIDKLINSGNNVEFHAVCHSCSSYIGSFDAVKTIKKCSACGIGVDLSKACNSNFFVIIDPSQTISDLLQIHEHYYDNVMKCRTYSDDTIADIYDGTIYREFVNSLPGEEKQNYVTSIFNTDGAPKFKSSQFSIWPIYLMLNELPIQDRLKNLLCCGLWINRNKPDMSVFLNPFVDVINTLSFSGITCTIKNEERLIKLYVLGCCVDSVARAPIQGIKQFNGTYGCSWCEHSGKYIFGSMRYPIMDQAINERDDITTVNHMININPDNPILGIKSPSPFINLQKFKIIQGFIPDYMHFILEGVGKQFTNEYLASLGSEEITVLDKILAEVQFPYQISRLTRPISIRDDWSAREWENFILFNSIPIFTKFLSKRKFDHWILLVHSLYILLQDNITLDDLDNADKMLYTFVAQTQLIFSMKMMTFNVHQLLHIGKSVLNWGPLWSISTFPFESENRNLLRAIKCARGATQQIVRFVNLNHSMLILREFLYPNMSDAVQLYCNNVLRFQVQNTLKITDIRYFGKGEDVNGDEEFLQLYGFSCSDTRKYTKIVKNGCLYNTEYNVRSNNSFAMTNNNKFAKLVKFIVDTNNKIEKTLCHEIVTTNFASHYKILQKIEYISENYSVIPTASINRICVIIKMENCQYLCPVANLVKY